MAAGPSRLRFLIGAGVRVATSPWLQRSISPEEATSLFGCSFGEPGWHHLRETLAQYDADPGIDAPRTALHRYLTQFCPSSTSALVDPRHPQIELPLFVYPWGTFRRGETASAKDPRMSRFCGPSSEAFVADEFRRTVDLYRRLIAEGYRPMRFGHTYIGGTFLIRDSGARRFVVLQGNHRMAILAHLGVEQIAVRNVRGWLTVVRESDIDRWPLVRSGACSRDHAHAAFRFFFENDGRHVQRLLADRRDAASH